MAEVRVTFVLTSWLAEAVQLCNSRSSWCEWRVRLASAISKINLRNTGRRERLLWSSKFKRLVLDSFLASETDMIFGDAVGASLVRGPYCQLGVGLCDVDASLHFFSSVVADVAIANNLQLRARWGMLYHSQIRPIMPSRRDTGRSADSHKIDLSLEFHEHGILIPSPHF